MEFSFYALRQLFHTAYAHPQKVPVILDNQAWTYSELVVQVRRVVYHLHRLNIIHGQIIHQFLERGFEMVCGLIDIMWAGSIYCPLNPSDPSKRICSILEQIQGQYVLLSEKIRNEFSTAIVKRMILFEQIMSPLPFIEDMHDLPHCRECGAVYIICTSDTTGRQNAAVSTHKSFVANIRAFSPWHLGVYMSRDQILQVANCSWVLHLREIPLSLASDGTLIFLDMANLSQILLCQQVTTLFIGPGIIQPFTSYMEMSQRLETFNLVSNLVVESEAVMSRQWTRLIEFLHSSNVRVFAQYSMSECSGALRCQLRDINDTAVPIGYPLLEFQCLLIGEQGQKIRNKNNASEIGQIHISASSRFNCYWHDPEHTANMFVTINNQVYLKTGDLPRYNGRGELVHVDRVDFQIKIRGQRLKTNKIENTIMNFSPEKISNCLVVKAPQNDDLLVAYVITNGTKLNTEQIRDYWKKHLRQYMVPSFFIMPDKLTLNVNDKVDRKQLLLLSLFFNAETNLAQVEDRSMSKLEEKIHCLWCSTLRLDTIPSHMNCFALGDSSFFSTIIGSTSSSEFDFIYPLCEYFYLFVK